MVGVADAAGDAGHRGGLAGTGLDPEAPADLRKLGSRLTGEGCGGRPAQPDAVPEPGEARVEDQRVAVAEDEGGAFEENERALEGGRANARGEDGSQVLERHR